MTIFFVAHSGRELSEYVTPIVDAGSARNVFCEWCLKGMFVLLMSFDFSFIY